MNYYGKLIERYVSGEMTPEEMAAFEGELKINPQLALEFRLEQELTHMLRDEEMMDFHRTLVNITNQHKTSSRRFMGIVPLKQRWYYVAAGIVLLLSLGAAWLLVPRQYTSQKLFSMYYNPGDILSTTRTGTSQIFDALLKFQQKDYPTAIILFENVLGGDPENMAIRFYKGIALIETGQYREAIDDFRKIINHGDNLFIERATWFLGLTYLKIDDTAEARKVFTDIANDKRNAYRKDAEEILAKLKDNS